MISSILNIVNIDFWKASIVRKFDLNVPGIPDNIPNIMRYEDPPPNPSSETNSPNHIIIIEPAVNVADMVANSRGFKVSTNPKPRKVE